MAKYTTLEQIDLPAVADSYGLDDPRLAPLAGGAANSSFRLSTASAEFVLTILDNHDTASAESLAAHTQALFLLGVPTSAVVPATDGSLITHFDGRPVILKVWTEGRVEQPLPVKLLPEAGRILAQLHALSTQSPGLTDIPVGTRRLSADHEALIPELPDREFAAWLTDRLNRIHRAEATNHRPRTVTHGDLFDDNVIVRTDGSLTVLDWETISLDDPLLDLGMAAVGLAQENGELAPERVKALVAELRADRPALGGGRGGAPRGDHPRGADHRFPPLLPAPRALPGPEQSHVPPGDDQVRGVGGGCFQVLG